MKKQYKSGKPSKEDKAAQREEKKQAEKDDKWVRGLATKGHRLLDTMVSKFEAYSMKLKKVEDLDYDYESVQAFEALKETLTSWHVQCQAALGKISSGKPCTMDDLGFDEKGLQDSVKTMKEIQKNLNMSIQILKKGAAAAKGSK